MNFVDFKSSINGFIILTDVISFKIASHCKYTCLFNDVPKAESGREYIIVFARIKFVCVGNIKQYFLFFNYFF